MTSYLLIPTSKIVPLDLRLEFGDIPTCMIPVRHSPAVSYITSSYSQLDVRPILAVHEGSEQIEAYYEEISEQKPIIVDVGSTSSLGETVYKALPEPSNSDSLIINFGDTLLLDRIEICDTIYCAEVEDSFRWTTFQVRNGKIRNIVDKNKVKGWLGKQSVFAGVFVFTQIADFKDCLRQSLDLSSSMDPFYSAVIKYFNAVVESGRNLENDIIQYSNQWLDFGHIDTYQKSKRFLVRSTRNFNHVDIDCERGLIRKESENTQKLVNEISWYHQLPIDLRHIAPRVLESSLDKENPYVVLEYYGYPSLAELYLYGAYDYGVWELVIRSIDSLMQEMSSFQSKELLEEVRKSHLQSMYQDKTLQRVNALKDISYLAPFWKDTIEVNGTRVVGLSQLEAMLPQTLVDFGLLDCSYFTVVHGDFCFSNILFDRRTAIVRLVDPRGEFGVAGIYGDCRYDLAKLCHSIFGNYDLIVNGMFSLEENEDSFSLEVKLSSSHRQIQSMFREWRNYRFTRTELSRIDLLESLLFISMAPLHSDQPEAQKAFLVNGLHRFSLLCGAVDG